MSMGNFPVDPATLALIVSAVVNEAMLVGSVVSEAKRQQPVHDFTCFRCKRLMFWTISQIHDVLKCPDCQLEYQINLATYRPYYFTCGNCHRPVPVVPTEPKVIACPFEENPKTLFTIQVGNPHPTVTYHTSRKIVIKPCL